MVHVVRLFTLLALAALSGCACYDAHKNLAYGPDPAQTLDWYEPRKPGTARPAIIAVHGGAWRSGDKSWGEQVAERFVCRGYVVVSINYRLAPSARWPAQVEDCQTALRWVKSNAAMLGVDPARIGALGVSAGGHLAAMLGLRGPDRVRAAVCANGEGDVRVYGTEPIMADEDSILADVLGAGPPFPAPGLADLSPAAFARADARVMVVHSTGDPNVYYTQGERLHAALLAAGATTEMVRVSGSGHGRVWREPEALGRIRAFLDSHLR